MPQQVLMWWLRWEAWTGGQTDDDAKEMHSLNLGRFQIAFLENVKFTEYYFIGKTLISKCKLPELSFILEFIFGQVNRKGNIAIGSKGPNRSKVSYPVQKVWCNVIDSNSWNGLLVAF